MKKRVFKMEGIDCAHCAGKIERDLQKVFGESAVSLSFMTGRLTIEAEEDASDIEADVRRIAKKTEPDIVVTSVR